MKGNPITFKDPTGHEVPLTGYGPPRDGLLPGNKNPNDTKYQSEIANKYDLKDKGKIEAAAKEYQAGSQKGFNQGYSRTSGWASPTQGHNAKSDGQALEKSDLSGKSKAYKDGYKDSVGVGRAYGILGGLGTGIAEAAGLATAGGVGKTGKAVNAKNSSTDGVSNFKYDPRVRARGVEDPKAHNFPYSFDKEILSTKAIPKENGYNIFQKSGTMNNKKGSFEMGVTKEGIIDHRFFRPDKQ